MIRDFLLVIVLDIGFQSVILGIKRSVTPGKLLEKNPFSLRPDLLKLQRQGQ